MKRCPKCDKVKELDAFAKDSTRKDKKQVTCKACKKEHKLLNQEKIRLQDKIYRANNIEKDNARKTKWRLSNPEKALAATKKWCSQHLAYRCALQSKRRAAEIQRTPAWLNVGHWFEMECVYTYAAALNSVGLHYHVDHIIPLQGGAVSGLHVPENLQVITAKENMKKGNKYYV